MEGISENYVSDLIESSPAVMALRESHKELLEALKGLVELHRRDDYLGLAKRYQDQADAAIEKAEALR